MTHYECPKCQKRFEHDQAKDAEAHVATCSEVPASLLKALKALSPEQVANLNKTLAPQTPGAK
jgi:hypothetical protein